MDPWNPGLALAIHIYSNVTGTLDRKTMKRTARHVGNTNELLTCTLAILFQVLPNLKAKAWKLLIV